MGTSLWLTGSARGRPPGTLGTVSGDGYIALADHEMWPHEGRTLAERAGRPRSNPGITVVGASVRDDQTFGRSDVQTL